MALRARFPDGPTDAEALIVRPAGDLFIITKGRNREIALYRYPAPQRPDEIVTLERVRTLLPEPKDDDDRVTSAAATPDGRWIGVRTYRTLYVYDGTVWLSSEAANKRSRPQLSTLACSLP